MANVIETVIKLKDDASKGLKDFNSNIGGVKDGLEKLAVRAGVTGAAITGAMTLMVRSSMQYGEEVNKMAERSGVASEAMSKLGYVAEIQESSIQELGMAFKFLDQATATAMEGSGAAFDAFRDMGISIRDASGKVKDSDVVFEEVIENFSKLGSEAEKSAAAMTLFGRAGYNMKPLLNTSKEALIQLKEEAVKLGIVLTGVQTQALDNLGDELTKLSKGYVGVANTLTLMFLPQILTGIVVVKQMYMWLVEWIKKHEDLVKSVVVVVAVMGVGLVAFSAIAGAIIAVVGTISTLVLAWTTLQGAIALIVTPVGIAIASFLLIGAVIAEWIVILYVCRDDIKTIFTFIGEFIWDTLAGTGKAIMKWGTDVLKYFSDFGSELLSSIGTVVEWIAEKVGFIPKLGPSMKAFILGLKEDSSTVAGVIGDKISALATTTGTYFKNFRADASTVGGAVLDAAKSAGAAMVSPFAGMYASISTWMGKTEAEVVAMFARTTEGASTAAEDMTAIEIKRLERSLATTQAYYSRLLADTTLSEDERVKIIQTAAESEMGITRILNEGKKISAEETAWALEDIEQKKEDNITSIRQAGSESYRTMLSDMVESTGQVYNSLMTLGLNSFTTLANGFGQSVAKMMRSGDSFSKTMKKVFESLFDNIIASLISFAATYIVRQALLSAGIIKIKAGEAAATEIAEHAKFGWVGIAMGIAAAIAITQAISAYSKFGDGGIVNGPTFALVGEKGPERITPLAKEDNRINASSTSGNTFQIIVNADRSAGSLEDIIDAARTGTAQAIEASLLLSRLANANMELA